MQNDENWRKAYGESVDIDSTFFKGFNGVDNDLFGDITINRSDEADSSAPGSVNVDTAVLVGFNGVDNDLNGKIFLDGREIDPNNGPMNGADVEVNIDKENGWAVDVNVEAYALFNGVNYDDGAAV
jgi:hypothetical protein